MTLPREKIIWTTLLPQFILLIISTIWIYISPQSNVLKYLKFDIKLVFVGIVVGVLLALAGYGFYKYTKKTKNFGSTIELFEQMLAPVFKNLNLFDIVSLSIISGFCEEVLFRGLVLPSCGIAIASVSFGLLHLPGFKFWVYAVWATLSGFLLGWFFLLSNSLWLPITAHVVNNILGMLMLKKLNLNK